MKSPLDIEGLWSYVYYSYSVSLKRVTGFIKFGTSKFDTFTLSTVHPETKQIRLIAGGNDNKRYPGLNG